MSRERLRGRKAIMTTPSDITIIDGVQVVVCSECGADCESDVTGVVDGQRVCNWCLYDVEFAGHCNGEHCLNTCRCHFEPPCDELYCCHCGCRGCLRDLEEEV